MAYGIKYQLFFDPVATTGTTPLYTLNILEKDYLDDIIPVTGSGAPVIHSYQTDDPKPPIKGSSLSVNLVNITGNISLDHFYSVNDDQFKVQLWWDNGGPQLMFEGFLVQDDCSETLLDYAHEINLSANDNLGLLKDVALDKADVEYQTIGSINDMWSRTAPHTVTIPSGALADSVQAGDVLRIHSLIFDVDYHVTDVSANPDFLVEETVTTGTTGTSDDITLLRPILFADKITLLKVIKNCLAATNLELETDIFCNFEEIDMDPTISFMEQTLHDPQTWLKDAVLYDNCYTILEKIMKKFRCTLVQAKGVWNIVHWDELRYSGYPIPGYAYDSDFDLIGGIKLNHESMIFAGFNKFNIQPYHPESIPQVFAETGLQHRVLRPYQFTKETFNFKPPAQFLRNFDLQQLGALQQTYTTGSGINLQTIDEYDIPWWVDDVFLASVSPPPPIHFIRVIYDFLQNEIERYLVIGNDTTRLDSYKIEATQGDIINLSLSQRTTVNTVDGIIAVFICLDSGFDHKFLTPTGWVVGQAPYENTFTGDSNNWNSFTTDSFKYPMPNDGLLYIILFPAEDSAGNITTGESQFNNIRLDYNYFINQSTKIVGQTHTTTQNENIKQNEADEIFLDDSPRNNIAGTLFLPTTTGVIQDRTVAWYLNNGADQLRIGQLTTFEDLFWRRKVRSILEGSIRGLIPPETLGDHLSMLGVFTHSELSDLNFIWGRLEIDYKNNKCSGTLYEIYDEGEVDGDLTAAYEFKYLYAPK